MLKDLRLAMAAAQTAGIAPRIGAVARELYEAFDAAGNGGRDFSAIITQYD
jgi:3-hydroxyisobutyrate dehydrogenase